MNANTESTSAALRRVEQERDDARQALETMRKSETVRAGVVRDLNNELAARAADVERLTKERDEALHDLAHARFGLDMTKTRLEHARAELETLRKKDTHA